MLDQCVDWNASLSEASLHARRETRFDDESRLVRLRIEVLSLKLEILDLIRTKNKPTADLIQKFTVMLGRVGDPNIWTAQELTSTSS